MVFKLEPLQSGGEPLVLCFVDFLSPAHAATALDALQGKIDSRVPLIKPFLELDASEFGLDLPFLHIFVWEEFWNPLDDGRISHREGETGFLIFYY